MYLHLRCESVLVPVPDLHLRCEPPVHDNHIADNHIADCPLTGEPQRDAAILAAIGELGADDD